jgi:hypothetical protein
MNFKPFFALVITALILSACSGMKLQDYESEKCVKLPGEKTLSVIKDKCGLCHKGDFATKELICSRKASIVDSVTTGRMPKFGKLSDEELKTILKWEL